MPDAKSQNLRPEGIVNTNPARLVRPPIVLPVAPAAKPVVVDAVKPSTDRWGRFLECLLYFGMALCVLTLGASIGNASPSNQAAIGTTLIVFVICLRSASIVHAIGRTGG